MTNSNENTSQFLFLPIVLALLFVFGAAALIWVSQVRTAPELAEEAEVPEAVEAVSEAAGEEELPGNPTTGETLFVQTCAACHGPEGEGVPGLGKSLITSEFVADQSNEQLIEFIKVGRDPSHPLNTTGIAMPPKGGNPSLDDEDLQDIISFMRTIHQ